MGCILIGLGLALYAVRGTVAGLALPVVGIVLLAVGVVWKPKQKNAPAEGNALETVEP